MECDDKHILSELALGNSVQTIITGNSMHPILKEGYTYLIVPMNDIELKIGDVVFVNIKNKFLTHMILNVENDNSSEKKFIISNVHKKIDGIVTINSIYGVVILD